MFQNFLIFVETHFDHILLLILTAWIIILGFQGRANTFFAFLKEMLSDDVTKVASTKRFGYFIGVIILSWGHVQLTRALCSQIKDGKYTPTTVYIASLGILATLVGAGYLFGKLLGQQARDAGLGSEDTK